LERIRSKISDEKDLINDDQERLMSTLILAISSMISEGCEISKDALTFGKSATQQRTRSNGNKTREEIG
jgi:hypothetical protein